MWQICVAKLDFSLWEQLNASLSGLEISGCKSYFATKNFVLTTMTINVAINLKPGFSTLCAIGTYLAASNFDL